MRGRPGNPLALVGFVVDHWPGWAATRLNAGYVAEAVRFELTDPCGSAVFKTAGLNRSPKPPGAFVSADFSVYWPDLRARARQPQPPRPQAS